MKAKRSNLKNWLYDYAIRVAEESWRRSKASKASSEKAYFKRLDACTRKIPDFDRVARKAKNMIVSATITAFIQQMKDPAQLLYYFAQHPRGLARLNKMSTIPVVRELIKLESKLQNV